MAGDYSRRRFDASRHYAAVLEQQGRVRLDADWNEHTAIQDRRWRAETVDIVGRCWVPRETPNAFQIEIGGTVDSKTMRIGLGRIYVHGLLAENFGNGPETFDLATLRSDGRPAGVLGELIGDGPIPYDGQPYRTAAPELPPGAGPFLVYLDVWQREVTATQDTELVEPALGGVDTTTRLQTVWQVRVHRIGRSAPRGVTCATPDAEIPGWPELTAPSAARVSIRTREEEVPSDPCLLPPSGGYRGLENQLYRIEIHDSGELGDATFKWSRDNATVTFPIEEFEGDSRIRVASVGRDEVLGFTVGDWVEITNDGREWEKQPGHMARVTDINPDIREITLSSPLPEDWIPSGSDTAATLHSRVTRWDQKGSVVDADGNELVNLDADNSRGVIPVPANPDTWVALEQGIEVSFHFNPDNGRARSGDYWLSAARTASASIESLEEAPPLGIHHHYCRLAIVTWPPARGAAPSVLDCRILWPPEFGEEDCACTVCVTAESHNHGTLTIQQAIERIGATGGTVCLSGGDYVLGDQPLQIETSGVTIAGQPRTILFYAGGDAAVRVRDCSAITIKGVTVIPLPLSGPPGSANAGGGGGGFSLSNVSQISVRDCIVREGASGTYPVPAISVGGRLLNVVIANNILFFSNGIGRTAIGAGTQTGLFTANVCIADNRLDCTDSGIHLGGGSFHVGALEVHGNTFNGCRRVGLSLLGFVAPGGRCDIRRNVMRVIGVAMRIGTHALIRDNVVTALAAEPNADGITLVDGATAGPIACWILDNRISGVRGWAIAIRGERRVGAVLCKNNIIRQTGLGALLCEGESDVARLVFENNDLVAIASSFNDAATGIAAVHIQSAERVECIGNRFIDIASAARQSPSRAAVRVEDCDSVTANNNIFDHVGPPDAIGPTTGIVIIGDSSDVQVSNNRIVVGSSQNTTGTSVFRAVLITTESSGRDLPDPFISFMLLDGENDRAFMVNRFRVRSVPRRPERQLTVTANQCTVVSRSPMIEITARQASCCILEGNHLQGRSPRGVQVEASRIVASNNRINLLSGGQIAMSLSATAATIVGNIGNGRLLLNDENLQAPWSDLNSIH